MTLELAKDPYNIIITGVGGQGNVMASRMLGGILAAKGLHVTIGETFGASQRGGSVMSHLRVSRSSAWSPQIPRGGADLVVALEPIEALRVMPGYGNPGTRVLGNTRPVYPVQVIAGEFSYPSLDELKDALAQLTEGARFIDATDEAIALGNPILGNVVMLGAVAGLDVLPFDEVDFGAMIRTSVPTGKVEVNMKAFRRGVELARPVH